LKVGEVLGLEMAAQIAVDQLVSKSSSDQQKIDSENVQH
jgi:hypothetical protein